MTGWRASMPAVRNLLALTLYQLRSSPPERPATTLLVSSLPTLTSTRPVGGPFPERVNT